MASGRRGREMSDMEYAGSSSSEMELRRRSQQLSNSSNTYQYEEEEYEEEEEEEESIEKAFEGKPVPTWGEQLTVRSFAVGLLLSFFLSFIVMKLNLTTGIVPTLNVSAGLLGFFMIKWWTSLLEKGGLLKQPFTRQENTVIQTCVVAAYGVAFSGGYGSYIIAMSSIVANQQSEDRIVDGTTKEPALGWVIAYSFVVSFIGLFSVVPLSKIMIIGYKLTYPSGQATAHLINSFHTPEGASVARKQFSWLSKSLSFSFCWSLFGWFYTGGSACGFPAFPSLGLTAYKNTFFFDFSATYVGVGMICPYIINFSLFIGSVISWGIMWPYFKKKEGIWFPKDLAKNDLSGIQGYKVFIPIAIILGDGLYHFVEVLIKSSYDFYSKTREDGGLAEDEDEGESYDDIRRNKFFLQDEVPLWVAIVGYTVNAAFSVVVIPYLFPQLKYYHIIVVYLSAPLMAFCNSYGTGLTDWSLSSTYGKLAIFVVGAWVGQDGGVLASLAGCGILMSIVSTASDLVQDMKTGHLTLASPRAMFVSQVVGTAFGCISGPIVFWIFWKAFPIGAPESEYPAPYAGVYRGIAIIGAEGLSALPRYCVNICIVCFFLGFGTVGLKSWFGRKGWWFASIVPSPMALAVPFFVGSYFTIDMCVGSLILYLWRRVDPDHADAYAPALASGLICGDGVWSLPSSILSMLNVQPPICMKFLSSQDNAKVDKFLDSR